MFRFLGSFKQIAHFNQAARSALYNNNNNNSNNKGLNSFALKPHNISRLLRLYYFGRPYSSSIAAAYRATKCSSSSSSNITSPGRICFRQLLAGNKAFSSCSQLAFSRLYRICSSNYSPIMKLARAVSLGLARSNLVAPGIISILIGKFARTETAWAQAERFDALCMQVQDGHLYFKTLLLSLLDLVVLLVRTLYIAVLFSPCLVMAPFADSFGDEFRKTWLKVVHQTLEKAGPAFIKWGQWAATRPDLFDQDLCDELTKLHTNAPAHSFTFTKKSIEMAFGRKLYDIFDNFDEEPVASGSVAQIHRATLKFRYPGQPIKPILVAVKVRHPGVGEAIRRDFAIINFLATISNVIPTLRWLRLDESIQQFAVFMMSQVDLAKEAANLSRFIYNFRSSKDVSFPRPLYPLVHPAVLVETFEHGENISYYVDQLKGRSRIKNALAHIGTHALLKMLLVDNFIHADMHPGNILVRTKSNAVSNGIFESRPQLVFLDVGMTAELSKRDRLNLIEFFKAIALRDGRTAAECTLRLSNKQSCPDPEAFIKEVETYFHFWGTPEGESIHPAECIQQLLEQVRRHRVNIDGNVCTVMVTTLVLEGWQQKLDPKYDIMQALQNLLFKVDWAESLQYTIEGVMAP